jgi:hypothetical protein
MNLPPFPAEDNRKEFARRLSAIPIVSIPETALTKRPSFKLSLLTADGWLNTFLKVFTMWLGEEEIESDEGKPVADHHDGDDSEFVARKADQPPPKSKKPKR